MKVCEKCVQSFLKLYTNADYHFYYVVKESFVAVEKLRHCPLEDRRDCPPRTQGP